MSDAVGMPAAAEPPAPSSHMTLPARIENLRAKSSASIGDFLQRRFARATYCIRSARVIAKHDGRRLATGSSCAAKHQMASDAAPRSLDKKNLFLLQRAWVTIAVFGVFKGMVWRSK